MKQQRILMEWPAERLLKALELVTDEQNMSPLRKRMMMKKYRKHAKDGNLKVHDLETEELYRLCAAGLMQHDYHWFGWEWRSEWVAKLATQPWCYPPWFGVDAVQKRILVVAEQGLGDEIVFASCYHELARDVEEAWVEVDPRLIPTFERSFPGNLHFVSRFKNDARRIVPRMEDYPKFHEGRPIEAFIPAGNVPKLYRQAVSDFPVTRRGFLVADMDQAVTFMDIIGANYPTPYIGCSWKGRQGKIDPILAGVSLQYGTDDHHGLMVPPIDLKWDFDGTLALIAALDKVVCTTNAVAHMAGALGVPTDCIKPPPIYATKEDQFNNRVTPWWPVDYTDWYPSITMYRNQNEWRAQCEHKHRS